MRTTRHPRERLLLGLLDTREDRLVTAALIRQKTRYWLAHVTQHPEYADYARSGRELARRLETAQDRVDAGTRVLADEHHPSIINQHDDNTRRAARRARRRGLEQE